MDRTLKNSTSAPDGPELTQPPPPRFNALAEQTARPVVPLERVRGVTMPPLSRGPQIAGQLPGRRTWPPRAAIISVLVAAVVIGAATIGYKRQHLAGVPTSTTKQSSERTANIGKTSEQTVSSQPSLDNTTEAAGSTTGVNRPILLATIRVPAGRMRRRRDQRALLRTIRQAIAESGALRKEAKHERDGEGNDH